MAARSSRVQRAVASVLLLLLPAGSYRTPHTPLRRRQLISALAAATVLPRSATAIVKGDSVSDAEAAAAGVVGLYIDLAGCTVCRPGIPATCTGTLVAPDLVLSARHCVDVPNSLNGTLSKVVFAADMLRPGAPSLEIEKYVTTADYGIETAGNDLLLIKLRGRAPAPWRPVPPALALLPSKQEQQEAARAGSPFYPDGLGFPSVVSYGYGQTSVDGETRIEAYSAGRLKKLGLEVRTEIRPWAPGFLTTPSVRGAGTCAGDSGGAALLRLREPTDGARARSVLLGVQAAASKPCVDNQAIFIYPQAFASFITKASRDLGSQIEPGLSWRDYAGLN